MKRLSAVPTGFARRICALCFVVLMLTGAAALAQSTDATNPPPATPQPSKDEATGGCDPIGLTASGEIVFPFRCKDEIERRRAAAAKPAEPKAASTAAAPAAVDQKPQAHVETKPAATAKTTSGHPASVAPATAKPAAPVVDAAHQPKTVDAKPVDAKPAEAKSANAKPTDAKSTDAKSTDAKSTDAKTAEIPKAVQQVTAPARDRAMGPPGCTHFRSYNAASATYLAFDGQRRPCREIAAQPGRRQVAGNQATRTQSPPKPAPASVTH